MVIFQKINEKINLILNNLDMDYVNNLMSSLYGIITLYITIKIIFEGYKIMTGKTSAPATSLLNDALWWVIIIGVAFNHAGWLDLVNTFIEDLKTWAGGGASLYTQLDLIFTKVLKLSVDLIAADSWTSGKMNGIFGALLILASFGLLSLVSIGTLIVTAITIKFLIMLAPLMIISLLFNWTKQTFYNWMQTILANTLTLIFVGILFQQIIKTYDKFITYVATQSISALGIWGIVTFVVFTSIILTLLVYMARSFATKVAGTSMEDDTSAAFKKGWATFKRPFNKN